MKETFGKWFLDVAKYILTALFLTTAFMGMEESKVLVFTSIGFLVCIFVGFALLWQVDKEKERKEKNKRKNNKNK